MSDAQRLAECEDALEAAESKAAAVEAGLLARRFGSIEEIERELFPELYRRNHPPAEPHPEIGELSGDD